MKVFVVFYRSRNPLRRKHLRASTHTTPSNTKEEQFKRDLVAEYGRTDKRIIKIIVRNEP